MVGSNFAALIRFYTGTTSTTLTDTNLLLLANAAKIELAGEIVRLDEDYFDIPMTRDLIASSSTNFEAREYDMPYDVKKIVRVQAKLDGTNWVKLSEFNATSYRRPAIEAQVVTDFSNDETSAKYDFFRRSLWIYSGTITATVSGLEVWATIYPADITAAIIADSVNDLSVDPTTTSFALPIELHELWARKVSIMWKQSREKPIPLTETEMMYSPDLNKALSGMTPVSTERVLVGELPDDSRLQG